MTSLTLYGSNVASVTLATAGKLATSSGGTETSASTAISTSGLEFEEFWALGTATGQNGSSTIPSPSGHGWLYDSTALEGQTITAGIWGAVITADNTIGATGTSVTFHVRMYKRSSGGVYTTIGDLTLTGQNFTTTKTTYTMTSASLSAVSFSTGDKLYVDCIADFVGNTWGAGSVYNFVFFESNSATAGVNNDLTITTPGYSSSAATKDTTYRGKLSKLVNKDTTYRGIVSKRTNKDTTYRGKPSKTITKDTSYRGTISKTANKDTTYRGKVVALGPKSGGCAIFANGTGTASYDHFRAIQYPDPSAPLNQAGRATSSVVNWNANIPNGTSLTTYTSLDDGATYQLATNASDIAGISTLLYSTRALQFLPIAHFHLNDTGASAIDATGNGYTGTLNGTITTNTVTGPLQGPGEIGNKAMQFDGTTGWISGSAATLPTGSNVWGIGAWINISSNPSALAVIASFGTWNVNNETAFIAVDTSGHAQIGTFGGNHSSSKVVTDGTWHHLVGVYDGSNMYLYVDGVLVLGPTAQTMNIVSSNFAISSTPGSLHDPFSGKIAEVTFFGSFLVLAASDIAALYNAGLSGIGQIANDSFTADTHTSYSQTFGSGGSGAIWTWDTANSRLSAVGGSKAHLLYNNLWSYDIDLLGDFYQSENSGFVWGYQDASNYYSLNIKDAQASVGANTVTLFKTTAGTATQLATTSVTWQVVSGGVTTYQIHHRFHLTMLAGVITVSMDENQILTYTDSSPFPAGLAGLRNDTGTSYIYLLAITPQPVDLSSKFIVSKHVLTTTSPTVTPQLTDHQAFAADPTFGPGVLVPSADYTQTYVSDNIDELNTKSNYWWQVGPSKNVIFQPRNATNSPWILQSTDVLIGTLPTVEYSGDLYRNRQTLKGVYDVATFGEIKHGDGQTRTWNVANPVVAVPTITLNGLAVTVGLQGKDTGKQYYYTFNDVAIVQDNSQAILQSTDVLAIQYSGAFGIDFSLDNTGQITDTVSQATLAALDGTDGIVEAVEDVTSQNMNVAAATAYANSLLQRYGSIARTIKFDTLHGGLKPGHNLPIFIPQLNIFDSTFLVVEVNTAVRTVSINGVVQVQYVYSVVASEAAALSSWVKLFSKVMRSVSGSHAKV